MLYLKVAELLSSGLQTAIDQIRAGKLCLSSTVKQGEWGLRGAPMSVNIRDRLRRVGPWGETVRGCLEQPAHWGSSRDSGMGGRVWRGAGLDGADSRPDTVVRKLNELYKASVLSCQGLSLRLQRFFLDKQRLLDRIQSVTAEKLIFSHAVHTVQPWGHRAGGVAPGWEMTPHSPSADRWPLQAQQAP